MDSETISNRRSSILKDARKSKNESESPDITERPARRVSFANSNYIKPFTTDPEANTIWDNTYEEEVNHTDSYGNQKSETIKIETNQTIYTTVSVDITRPDHVFVDKENVNPLMNNCDNNVRKKSILDYIKKQKSGDISTVLYNKNVNEGSDMEVTCDELEFTCHNSKMVNEIDTRTAENSNLRNVTLNDDMSMELTTQIPKHLKSFEDFNTKNITLNSEASMELTRQIPNMKKLTETANTDIEMEFTCQVPTIFHDNMKTVSEAVELESTGMEFTCQVPTKFHDIKKIDLETLELKSNEMEFTCLSSTKLYGNRRSDFGAVELRSNEMEFACQDPTVFHDNRKTELKTEDSKSIEMEFTCQASANTQENKKNDSGTTDFKSNEMEFTCQVPTKNHGNRKSDLEAVQLKSSEMEFTCQVHTNLHENKQIDLETKDLKSNEIEFTCQIPTNVHEVKSDFKTVDLRSNENEARKEDVIDIGPNVVYSENVGLVNKSGLAKREISHSSFHMNFTNISSGVDDTQQLINCTFSNMNYLSRSNMIPLPEAMSIDQITLPNAADVTEMLKETETTINDERIRSHCESASNRITVNDTYYIKNKRTSTEGIAVDSVCLTDEIVSKCLKTADDTYSIKDKKTSACNTTMDEKFENTTRMKCFMPNLSQESTIDLISDDSGSENINQEPTVEDYVASTEKYLKSLKLIKYDIKIERYDLKSIHDEIKKQRQQIVSMIKNFKPRPIIVPTTKEIVAEIYASLDLNNITQPEIDTNNDLESLDILTNNDNTNYLEKIKDLEKQSENSWSFVKTIDDIYHFVTLDDNLRIVVKFNSSGIVEKLTVEDNFKMKPKPIILFIIKQFKDKLSSSSLKLSLGLQYDIRTLLHYVQMIVQRLLKFEESCFKLGSCDLIMHEDFMISFKILNLPLTIWWEIKLNANDLENVTENDITIRAEVGICKEEEIKGLVINCPKGLNFIESYIKAINNYVENEVKRKKLMKG